MSKYTVEKAYASDTMGRTRQARKFESDPWKDSNQYFDDVQTINVVW